MSKILSLVAYLVVRWRARENRQFNRITTCIAVILKYKGGIWDKSIESLTTRYNMLYFCESMVSKIKMGKCSVNGAKDEFAYKITSKTLKY